MSTLLRAAAKYAFDGLSVFPCEKKIPLTGTGGFKNATLDASKIAQWWTEHPNAQIGLPTGEVNHLFVIDVDGPEGERAAEKLKLPETFTVVTRPGRYQLWFRQPDGVKSKCSAGVLSPQLDTRGDGGYVVAPPSIHHETGKPYQVVKNIAWAEMPSFLGDVPSKANGNGHVSGNTIPQGRRHQTMLQIAGALRARGLSREMVLAQLQIANERQCVPPLDFAELEKLADYVGSKAPGFPGHRPMETSAEVELESFSQVHPEKVRWLWEQRVPLGKLTLFVGHPGYGKSLTTIDIGARVSTGKTFPDGARCDVGDVIFLSAEDDASDTVRPRLDAAGADVARVHRVRAVKVTLSDGATGESVFSLDRDVEKLDEAIQKIPGTRLLIVDPISAYMGKIDTHRDAEVRRVLTPLAELAAKRRVGVIGVMHLRKGEASALLRISQSVAFIAAARAAWGFGEDPDAPENRVMVAIKNNLAPLGNGLAYQIQADASDIPRIAWQPGNVTLDANEVLSSDRHENRTNGPRQKEAEEWLCSLLANGDEKSVSEIMGAADKAGIAWRTLKRAKQECGVRHVKKGREWLWVLA